MLLPLDLERLNPPGVTEITISRDSFHSRPLLLNADSPCTSRLPHVPQGTFSPFPSVRGPLREFLPEAVLGIRKDFAMSKLQWDAQEKMDLLAYLEALLGCVKSLHASVGSVMADVAAIRNTMFEDPEELALYRANLRAAVATAKPVVDETLRSYDDLLQEIVDSQPYPN